MMMIRQSLKLLPLLLPLLFGLTLLTTATASSSSSNLESVQNIPDGSIPRNFFSLVDYNAGLQHVLLVVDNEPRSISRSGRNGLLDAIPIKSGSSSQVLQYYGLNTSHAIFVARDGGALELWVTDGSYRGTSLLHKFVMKFNRRRPPKFTIFREELYFVQGPQLWKIEESASGDYKPVQVHDLSAQTYAGTTAAEVKQEEDQDGDANSGGGESIYTMYVWQDLLFISMGNNGGLFRTDGTSTGLQMIATDVSVKFQNRQPALTGSMYFITTSKQLWKTDGTMAGTGPVALDKLEFTEVVDLFQYSVNNRIVFGLGDSKKPHLFSTDGTSEGTAPLAVQLEDGFVFEETVLPASDLYVIDFRSPFFGETFYFPGQIAGSRVVPVADNRLAFTVDGAGPLTTGFSLWTTNGQTAHIIHEFLDTIPYDILDLRDGRLLIRTNEPDEIWLSDGYVTERLYSSVYNVDNTAQDTNSTLPSVYGLEQSWRGSYWAMLTDTELLFTGYNHHYVYNRDYDERTGSSGADGANDGAIEKDVVSSALEQAVIQQEIEVLKVNIPSVRHSQVSISKQQASGGVATTTVISSSTTTAFFLISTTMMAAML